MGNEVGNSYASTTVLNWGVQMSRPTFANGLKSSGVVQIGLPKSSISATLTRSSYFYCLLDRNGESWFKCWHRQLTWAAEAHSSRVSFNSNCFSRAMSGLGGNWSCPGGRQNIWRVFGGSLLIRSMSVFSRNTPSRCFRSFRSFTGAEEIHSVAFVGLSGGWGPSLDEREMKYPIPYYVRQTINMGYSEHLNRCHVDKSRGPADRVCCTPRCAYLNRTSWISIPRE